MMSCLWFNDELSLPSHSELFDYFFSNLTFSLVQEKTQTKFFQLFLKWKFKINKKKVNYLVCMSVQHISVESRARSTEQIGMLKDVDDSVKLISLFLYTFWTRHAFLREYLLRKWAYYTYHICKHLNSM